MTKSGQSLFEVIVAIGIVALVLVGAMSLSVTSLRNTTFSKNDTLATKYAQEGSEWLRQQRDTSWDTLIAYTGQSCLGTLSLSAGCTIPGTTFQRSITFVCKRFDPGPPPTTSGSVGCGSSGVNIVDAAISVSWTDGQGTHSVKNIPSFTSWR